FDNLSFGKMSYSTSSSGFTQSRSASGVEANQFKILIASDVHLGFAERHHLRADDSFRTFEEVLQAAGKHDVDLILLAGDLFHVNKPSIPTINRASVLIRFWRNLLNLALESALRDSCAC